MQVIVAANSGPARTGSISVAGQTVSVAQANGCTYGVAPLSQDIPGNGAAGTGSVMTASGCTWTATSSVDWITVSTPSGAGPGQVSFTVAPNPGPSRTGGISIAGQLLPVNQASLCTWVFAPPYHEFDATGGNGNVLIIPSGACSWTSVSKADWIQITAGASGVGNGLLQFIVPPNPGPARTGIIVVAGQDYMVRQGGT
jgi:hypothetical protein